MNPLYWPFIFNKTPVFYPFKDAPKPVAPYSHAVEAGGFVFTTGQLATGPDNDDRPNPAGFKAQTAKVMSNLNRVLKGLGLEHVMSVRVFLTHFEQDYAMMNMLYASYFPDNRKSARNTAGATGLARGGMIEIDMIAVRP